MSKIDELMERLCPDGVEYKTIQEICNITRGRVMSKDYIRDNVGEFPVYSSQTENNGELGKISTYDFEGEYITWTTDGANAGSVFYRNGKFSVTNVCGLLNVIDEKISTKFLFYALSIESPKYVNAGMGNPKLMSNVMAKIKVAVPPIEVQYEIVRILDDFTKLLEENTKVDFQEQLTFLAIRHSFMRFVTFHKLKDTFLKIKYINNTFDYLDEFDGGWKKNKYFKLKKINYKIFRSKIVWFFSPIMFGMIEFLKKVKNR